MARREHGSCTGTDTVYIVEARSTYTEPQTVGGMVLDQRWRRVHFAKAPYGVVNNRAQSAMFLPAEDFLDYAAASTLARCFLANAYPHSVCAETRLVKIKLSYSYSTEEVGVSEPLCMIEAQRAEKFTDRTEDETIPA